MECARFTETLDIRYFRVAVYRFTTNLFSCEGIRNLAQIGQIFEFFFPETSLSNTWSFIFDFYLILLSNFHAQVLVKIHLYKSIQNRKFIIPILQIDIDLSVTLKRITKYCVYMTEDIQTVNFNSVKQL